MATETGVYVSLALDRLPLLRLQERVCARFELTPRAELHVTLGYIGDAEPEPLAALARELAPLAREPLAALAVVGLGGAFADGSGRTPSLAPDVPAAEWAGRSRVLWWAVERSDALTHAFAVVRDAIRAVGLSDKYLPQEFYPHITVGSFSGPDAPDPRSWDVHDVAKLATLGPADSPATASARRLHVTRTALNPEGLYAVATYGAAGGG